MKYRPWLGISLLVASVPLDIALGRTAMVFFGTLVAVFVWSQYGAGKR